MRTQKSHTPLAFRESAQGRRAPKNKSGEREAEQIESPDLQAENETEQPAVTVRNGRMAVTYVKPHFDREKDDRRFVSLELSFPLSSEHEKLLPLRIREAWEFLESSGNKSITVLGVGLQKIEIGLSPEADGTNLDLKVAQIEKISLASIETTGTGEASEIMRLSFRVLAELDGNTDLERFACRHFNKQVWIKMEGIQGDLLRESA